MTTGRRTTRRRRSNILLRIAIKQSPGEFDAGQVALTDAQHRLREITPLCALFPGAALNAPCPGYGFPARCKSGSPDKMRSIASGKLSHSALFSRGRRLTRLARATGLQLVAGPVARTDAQHRLREITPLCALFPGAALNAPCPGYGFTARCRSGSPNRCAASPPGNYPTLRSFPGGGA